MSQNPKVFEKYADIHVKKTKGKRRLIMGMSASQARLIALTARMNDIEYQGQQINQQRTTLSNQVNALYNQLLETTVPTPPSTSDYTKVQYSGTSDASKFTLGNVVPTGKNSAGKDTYSVDFSYKRAGHSVSKSNNTATLTNTSQYLGYKNASSVISTNGWISTTTKAALGDQLTEKPSDNDKAVYLKVPATTYNDWASKSSALDVCDANGNSVAGNIPTETGAYVYIKCNAAKLDKEEFKSVIKQDNANKYTNLYDTKDVTTTGVASWLTDASVLAQNIYFVTDANSSGVIPTKVTTVAQLQELLNNTSYNTSNFYVRDTSANPEKQFTNPNYDSNNPTGLSVGDMKVYELSDAETKSLLGASYSDYMTALKNAFSSEYGSELSDSDIASKFYVYVSRSASGANEPHFIKKDELSAINNETSSVRTYEYDEDGTYTQTEAKKDCQMEFDVSTGRITKIGIPDGNGQISWVSVTAETVTDEKAYQEAFNDYEYDKAKYDKQQQEINAKTSIVQQEDKNLELKLTRLDNERNAVNTEIDAVKKVVSDNIEKSYKTFSG